jgi:hypothetical protein
MAGTGVGASRLIALGRRPLVLAAIVAAIPLWAACGVGGSGASSGTAPAALCRQLTAVFSDGPDPGADPVGYALSQESPLAEIHTSDHSAAQTIRDLVEADRALVATNGTEHSITKQISHDDAALNKDCPGVAP